MIPTLYYHIVNTKNRGVENMSESVILIVHIIAFLIVVGLVIASIYFINTSNRKKKSIQENKKAKEIYQNLVESAPVPFIIHRNGTIIYVNQATLDLVKYSKEEILNENILKFVEDKGQQDAKRRLARGYTGKSVFEQILRAKDGEAIEVDITAVETFYEGKPAVQMILHDLRSRKRSERTIKHMAFHDALTGVPNRMSFHLEAQKLMKKISEDKGLAFILLDLDRFKQINDTFGHSAGDDFLIYVSYTLKELIGEGNQLFRLSGDEFIILMPNVSGEEDVEKIVSKIFAKLRTPYTIENYKFHITCSMGIKIFNGNSATLEDILKKADTALYQAKEQGRNTYVFYNEKMKKDLLKKMKMENDLRTAIDTGEIEMHYQPQVHSVTGETLGLEALVRWNKKGEGYISPVHFISLAEETGLIFPLGEFIFRDVCRQINQWQQKNYKKVRVAINLSLIQFQQINFLEFIKSTLVEFQVEPSWLEIEITESIFLQDLDRICSILSELQSMGIKVAIDDFGTGYSSLNYLKNLPIDKLKIDRSFTKDLSVDSSGMAIVKSIMALAKNLSKDVIAEGVETSEQLELLKEIECSTVQGYYFSKPLNAHDVEKFLVNK